MRLTDKRAVVEELLGYGSVHILLNPDAADTVVPPQFHGSPTLQLEFGYDMAVPILDIEITASGIGCTLSFNRTPSLVFVPWGAIYGVIQLDVVQVAWGSPEPMKTPARTGFRVVE